MQIVQQTPASKHSEHSGANKFTQRANLRAGVLEDDHAVRKLYCEALQQEDVAAIPFENAFEMTVAVRANMVDIALIDLGLGSEDGMQIIRDLRVFSGLPILIVSGKPSPKRFVKGSTAVRMTICASPLTSQSCAPASATWFGAPAQRPPAPKAVLPLSR